MLQKITTHRLFAEAKKAFSFGLIGIFNGFVDFFAFMGFNMLLKSALSWETLIMVANILAWGVAVSSSYLLNSRLTFKVALTWQKYGQFALAGLAGLFVNTLTVVLLSYATTLTLAKIGAIGITFVVNFAVTRLFIFKN